MSRIIVVVGGGIVGLSCALALQERGERVRLIDGPNGVYAASWGNAGHIAVEQVEPLASRASIAGMPRRLFSRGGAAAFPLQHASAWVPFGLRLLAASAPPRFEAGRTALEAICRAALPAWRELVRRLGCPHLLLETGHYVFWETEGSARAGAAGWQSRPVGPTTVHPVEEHELRRVQNLLTAPLLGGVKFEGSASIADLTLLRETMGSAFHERGGELVRSDVVRLSDLDAETIVIAAGFGSATLLRQLGHRVPLVAERGYHLQAAETDWPFNLPPVVLEDRSLILTRFRRGLRAASFVEFGGHHRKPDPRKWKRLRRHVDELGIRFDHVTEWMGARPTFPDYLPAIGRSGRDPRVVYAFGHQHLGLTLGPVTGELVASLISGEVSALALEPFALDRFGR